MGVFPANYFSQRISMEPCPLVVRFGHIGDVLLTTGVLAYYGKEQGKKFDVVTMAGNSDIFIGHEFVNNIISFPKGLSFSSELTFFYKLSQYYAGQDLVDLHCNLRTYLLRVFWKGSIFSYNKMSMARRLFFVSRGFFCGESLRSLNVPQRYAKAFVKRAKIPSREEVSPKLTLSQTEKVWAIETLKRSCTGHTSYDGDSSNNSFVAPVALHPFASHAPKTWSKEKWLSLAVLLEKKGIPWIVLGKGENFFPTSEQNFINKNSLRESASLLSECRALVTGDSGPMHLASSVGLPVVALFGPTTNEWGFYPVGNCVILEPKVKCRPCSLHGKSSCAQSCLEQITPEQVVESLTLY